MRVVKRSNVLKGIDMGAAPYLRGYVSTKAKRLSERILVSDYGKNLLSPAKDFADFKAPEQTIAKSAGHYNEWIKAAKGEGE